MTRLNSNSKPGKNRPLFSFQGFEFTPGLIPSIAALVVFCLLVNLGFWQLRRAQEKEVIINRWESRKTLPATSLQQLDYSGKADLSDRPLTVEGEYLNQYQFLLDNRTYQGRAGFHLLTPFLTSDQQLLLVNRGWLPYGQRRTDIPPLPKQIGKIELFGHIHIPSPDYFVLKEDSYQNVRWPMTIQKIDLEKTAQLLDHPLLPFTLRLDPEKPSLFIREWNQQIMRPEKHLGYAVQWFSLALALLIIYGVVNTHRQPKP